MISAVLVGLVGDLEGELDAAVRWLRVLGERGDVEVAFQLVIFGSEWDQNPRRIWPQLTPCVPSTT